MMGLDWTQILIALLGSALAGGINTLAGNGSAITLTILTDTLGLPPNVANGTNRVGVIAQSWASTAGFYKHDQLNVRRGKVMLIFTCLGALGGVWLALNVSNEQFLQFFRYMMIFMLVVILVKPKRWLRETDVDWDLPLVAAIPLYLALGFYGGFIQMGLGVFMLTVGVLVARFSIMETNALKSLIVGIYTIPVLLLFSWRGLVDWPIGLLMAVGQFTGGYLTATYASRYPQANVWAHRLLVAVVVFAIFRLFAL